MLALIAGPFLLLAHQAHAGNEANFVLYDHHTDETGTTEIDLFNDFSNAVGNEPRYAAQLFELERALTDRWEAALYLEGDQIDGNGYLFGGWRLESRYRLFDYGAPLNPVLYVEYENLDRDHKYLLDVTGRTDTPDGPGRTQHEIESKLIVGYDVTPKFDVALNWINDTSLDTGRWEFGYALGFNYELADAGDGGHDWRGPAKASSWAIKEVKLGGELYGGLGDTTLGLTLDPNVTQQYAGLNLKTELTNGLHVMVGGAAGLTRDSERGLLRLMIGYEFE